MYLTIHNNVPKILLSMKKSPIEYEENKIIGIRPVISRTFSPIGINIEFPQAHKFSESKPERNYQYLEA